LSNHNLVSVGSDSIINYLESIPSLVGGLGKESPEAEAYLLMSA